MRLTIKVKLGLVFFATAVVLGTIGFYSLMNVNANTTSVIKTWMPGISISKELNNCIAEYRILAFKHVASGKVQEMQDYEKQMEQVEASVIKEFAAYNELINGGNYDTEEERQADRDSIDSVKKDWDAYKNVIRRL